MRTTLALVLALSACAPEAGEAPRDYTITGDCPVLMPRAMLCDEGVGHAPRFVPVETCFAEAGKPIGWRASWGIQTVTHPEARRCESTVFLVSYEDVRDRGIVF